MNRFYYCKNCNKLHLVGSMPEEKVNQKDILIFESDTIGVCHYCGHTIEMLWRHKQENRRAECAVPLQHYDCECNTAKVKEQ